MGSVISSNEVSYSSQKELPTTFIADDGHGHDHNRGNYYENRSYYKNYGRFNEYFCPYNYEDSSYNAYPHRSFYFTPGISFGIRW